MTEVNAAMRKGIVDSVRDVLTEFMPVFPTAEGLLEKLESEGLAVVDRSDLAELITVAEYLRVQAGLL
jgi:hypothetical protein